jgi:hypothetical protein
MSAENIIKPLSKYLTYILIGICLTISIQSCKKYEDDTEFVHFRTVRQRIEGYKVLTMHRFGSYDLMPYWHSRFGDFYIYLGSKCASESVGIEKAAKRCHQ